MRRLPCRTSSTARGTRASVPPAARVKGRAMSDFTSGFWNVFVMAITVASIAGCALLLLAMSKRRAKGTAPAAPAPRTKTTQTTGHVWDGDLAEYNNPLPKWWLNLFWITLVFAVVYLLLYPG